jgi:hypothetical protein
MANFGANTGRANARQWVTSSFSDFTAIPLVIFRADIPSLHKSGFELRFGPEWTAFSLAYSLHE